MEPAWLSIARSKIGIKEIPGTKHNQEIISWIKKDLGVTWYTKDEIPWCAGFANWCLKQAGEPVTNSLMARSFLTYGTMTKAKPGAILVFKRGEGSQGHVGFYVGETSTHYRVLGGNQGNSVSIKSYPKNLLLGIRWPNRLRKSRVVQGNIMSFAGVSGAAVAENADHISGFASSLTDGATQLQPLVEYSGYLTAIFIILTLAGIATSIYWRWKMMRRDSEISEIDGDV